MNCLNFSLNLPGKDVDQLDKNLARMYIVNSDTGTTGDICMLIAKASGRKRLGNKPSEFSPYCNVI